MIVLDASCALALAKGDRESLAMRDFFLLGEEVIAPDFLVLEVSNAAWKYVHAGVMTKEEASELRGRALGLVDRFAPIDSLCDEAFGQAVFHDHSVYDMAYLVLARRNDATLATLDQKLTVLAEKSGVGCLTAIDL